MSNCIYCGGDVVWPDVMATTEGQRTALTADSRGLLALEEKQQYVHMGRVCARCCDKPQPKPSPIYQLANGDYWCSEHDCSAYECECAWRA